MAPVTLGHRANEGQAQAGAPMVGVAVTEGLEQSACGFVRKTGALIADGDDADR